MRGLGSVARRNVARSALVVARDRENPLSPKRIMASTGSNHAADSELRSLVFTISGQSFHVKGEPKPMDVAYIEAWNGESHLTADELLAPTDPNTKSAADEAAEVLRDILQTEGMITVTDAKRRMRSAGVADVDRNYKAAAKALGLKRERLGGNEYWISLPGCANTLHEDDDEPPPRRGHIKRRPPSKVVQFRSKSAGV